MALQDSDLFVIQSQTDNQLYKVRLDALITEIEGQAGVNFRGSADLNNPPGNSGVTLPAQNGDMYIVESDAAAIDSGWVMAGGVTSATEGDRVIYDGDNNNWILISSGSANAGTVTGVDASLPLKSDGNAVTPVLSIREARTETAATAAGDGEGPDGAVHRLAEAADVAATSGTADPRAVVTADLLKATNDALDAATAGGVSGIVPVDPIEVFTSSNGGSTTQPAVGVKEATPTQIGVVQLASSADITAGTANRVVTADQLDQAITDSELTVLGAAPIQVDDGVAGQVTISVDAATTTTDGVVTLASAADITAGTAGKVVTADQLQSEIADVDTDLISTDGSITIDKANAPVMDIEVNSSMFVVSDFSSYPDISTAP